MKSKRQGSLINILSLALVLVCLFMPIIGSADSWFTYSGSNVVQITASMSGIDIALYHTSVASGNVIKTNTENSDAGTANYIPLNGAIHPDTVKPLTLIVENTKETSVYVKFKFEVYADGLEGDTLIPCSITNSGFTQSGDYFVYGNTAAGTSIAQNGTATLMTGFTIAYEDFETIGNSETIKLKVEVIASSVAFS